MQTVTSLAERLDMSAEEAVEKLQYMFFDVGGVESSISDEQCDILIDIDDDPALVEEIRNEKLKEKEKEEKAAAKRKAAAQKAAAKKKAKTAAKKKVPAKKKLVAKAKAKPKPKAAAAKERSPVAEILSEEEAKPVVAEILPEADVEKEPVAPEAPSIVIGSAIDHEEHRAEVVRADGTHVDVSEVDIPDPGPEAVPEDADEIDLGPLAQAERQQAEEDRRRAEVTSSPAAAPDPSVVAEVIRKANEKKSVGRKRTKDRQREQSEEVDVYLGDVKEVKPKPAARHATGSRKTGKTARKRQRKLERMRSEEAMRQSAAAAIKEYQSGAMDGGPKRRKKKRGSADDESGAAFTGQSIIHVGDDMTVEMLAQQMDVDATDIILELMEHNVMATKNQLLGLDLVRALAEPQGFEVQAVIPQEEEIMAEEPDDPADVEPRAPVVTVMGHVDHGKTSLLDQVRKASVAKGEAGGITQHIAAYEVTLPQGRVVFLDTPGHEAFTSMRARGAQVTDVVVLVVAADDGIMPQTREAIDHARAADVPIVVAINKCDKPDAEPERIRQELTQFELVDEQWGGKTILKNISALTGEGIDELMELLVLETELLELKANPNKRARGTIIESEITRGQGPVAWVLVKCGTLRVGDIFLAGETYGRVRAMQNGAGENLEEAGPSVPVVVMGFSGPPSAGDQFLVMQDERTARSIADQRAYQAKIKAGPAVQHITLEDFHEQLMAGQVSELNVVIKADVQGSVDVLESSLPEIGNEEVKVKIVHSGVGAINESDILLASASDAVVLGFHIEPTLKAEKLAQSEGVNVRTYRVIYEMIEDIRKSLEGLLAPEEKEVVTGHTEIRQIFKSSALGNIAGCMQIDGEIRRDSRARLLRDGEEIYEGKVDSLRREKESVSSVQSGFECGITLTNFDAFQEGDVIESYRIEEVAKTLA